ncbi:hypothetical protein NDI79_21515 [Halogeometricum sp. S3BR5-2]|uniref:Uncharacterized protein n=1 Tax=Halogeometricum luteum TaxID=2950537 RepID=A0ABU2G7I6_9EURY|nr:hypothetical protein [Halogeometricum sp. S3BR5-2]MDS0296750.1 hypothetical protein [Halogeometricum sp. S3BR5-2]
MGIEKRRLVPINRRVFVIELDMTGPKVRMVGILVEAEHQIAVRFDPVYAVVCVVDAGGVPEANLQSCCRRIVRVTQERRRIDIRDDVAGSASRRAIADLFTPWLVRQSVVNVAEEGPLCIAVATGKKDHSVREED